MKRLLFVLPFFLLGCPKDPVTPKPVPQDYLPGTCAGWCTHATELHCEAAKPTPNGASCTTVCENLEASGITHLNLGCRAKASSCTAADACEN